MLSDEIKKFMEAYGVDKSEVWPVPGGKAYAIKHSALERIAAAKGIEFGPPQIVEGSTESKTVVLLGTAMMGERREWSFGEASPANNKNAYCWAMAEKRLKDRLTLKHLAVHGLLYSEEEADSFKEPKTEPDNDRWSTTRQQLEASVRGLDHPPGKNKPPHWDAITKIVDEAESYSDLTYRTSQPFYKNTTSGFSNFYLRKLADEHYLPKVAEFRGAEVAADMQRRIHEKFPLDNGGAPRSPAEESVVWAG